MEGVRAATRTRHLEADQWLNTKEWCLGSGRRRQLSQDRKNRQIKPCLQDTDYCSCSVFTIFATCNVISHVKCVLYCYTSTFRSICAVLNMAGFFCSSLISRFAVMWFGYCLNDSEIVPVAPIIMGIAFVFNP